VRLFGFEAKCASVRAINVNVEECVTDRERTLRERSERDVTERKRAEAQLRASLDAARRAEQERRRLLEHVIGAPVTALAASQFPPDCACGYSVG
jgi:hypothetical protein